MEQHLGWLERAWERDPELVRRDVAAGARYRAAN
jgi:hypothetical protein